jgi:hypothetical protein
VVLLSVQIKLFYLNENSLSKEDGKSVWDGLREKGLVVELEYNFN